MADAKQTDEEPSIEEILDSIRQIISDDDEDGDAPAPEAEAETELVETAAEPEPEAAPEPTATVEAAPEEDVVELTQKVEDEVMEDLEGPEPELPPPPKPKPAASAPPEPKGESILSKTAKNAAYDGFSELARRTALGHDGITLEDIVRTELNPLLRSWLDKNLPKIIERLVREELEKISKNVLDE